MTIWLFFRWVLKALDTACVRKNGSTHAIEPGWPMFFEKSWLLGGQKFTSEADLVRAFRGVLRKHKNAETRVLTDFAAVMGPNVSGSAAGIYAYFPGAMEQANGQWRLTREWRRQAVAQRIKRRDQFQQQKPRDLAATGDDDVSENPIESNLFHSGCPFSQCSRESQTSAIGQLSDEFLHVYQLIGLAQRRVGSAN